MEMFVCLVRVDNIFTRNVVLFPLLTMTTGSLSPHCAVQWYVKVPCKALSL
jgi:hypothetical protein